MTRNEEISNDVECSQSKKIFPQKTNNLHAIMFKTMNIKINTLYEKTKNLQNFL